MSAKISIKEVVGTLEMLSDEVDFFLNSKTGEIRPVTQEDRFLLERNRSPEDLPAWQREELPLLRAVFESDEWLELPDRTDIHEWSIMERFSHAQHGEVRDQLTHAIHGRGAFRAFRQAVDRLGLRDSWFAFRYAALEEIARDWLEAHHLPFE